MVVCISNIFITVLTPVPLQHMLSLSLSLTVFVQLYLAPRSTIIHLIRICVQALEFTVFLFLSRIACSACPTITLTAGYPPSAAITALMLVPFRQGFGANGVLNLLWAQISAEMKEK